MRYTKNMEQKNDNKTTNEKPVSLSSLNLKEALAAFMKVKPTSKEKMDKVLKEQEENKKPSIFR